MYYFSQQPRGYTLVELLVYIAVFTGMSIIVINSVIVSMESFATARAHREVASAGNDVMENMTRNIRRSTNVDTSASSFDTPTGVLSLDKLTGEETLESTTFSIDDGAVVVAVEGVSQGQLTSDMVEITSLEFSYTETAVSQGISVVIDMQHNQRNNINATFTSTIGLRESY